MCSWLSPLPFISYKESKFILNEETVEQLKKIDKRLSVICIAGRLRGGKSYLMNRLVGKQSGFPLGSTVEAVTKGIWIWYVRHPTDLDIGVLLMDTEGLDDPDGAKREEFDMWILTISILLSSTFIYNEIGLIGHRMVERMSFVTELSKRIQYEADKMLDSNFDGFFPHFVLVIRDVTLQIEIDGRVMTDDEYMERKMLTAVKESKKLIVKSCNETKLKLRKYFPNRKCFTFVNPIVSNKRKPERLTDDELPIEFVRKTKEFCNFIFQNSPIKKIHRVEDVNGPMFVQLATIYLDAINKQGVPCIESANYLIAKHENSKAINVGLRKYRELMATIVLPVEKRQLEKVHMKAQEEAIIYFLQKSFLDDDNAFYESLQVNISNEYIKYVEENLTALHHVCQSLLEVLYCPIKEKVKSGQYFCENGYQNYNGDVEELKKKFQIKSPKGKAATIILESFLIMQQHDVQLILKKLMTEKDRKREKKRFVNRVEQLRLQMEAAKVKRERETEDVLARTFEVESRLFDIIKTEKRTKLKESYNQQFENRKVEIERLNNEKFHEHANELHEETKTLGSCYEHFLQRSAKNISETSKRVEQLLSLTIAAIKFKLRETICGETNSSFNFRNPFA